MNAIEEAKKSNYKYLPPIVENYEPSSQIITVIVDCYYGLNYVQQSVQSILDQDYRNVELMLIDNGAEQDVSEYLHNIYVKWNNVALIEFKENQFSWDDIDIRVAICWNVGVLNSKGSIIGHINYDDMLSVNYCSKMVKLFEENGNCISVGAQPISIDSSGNINKEISRRMKLGNSRPRYIDGKRLALDLINGNPNRYFSAPGGMLWIKKEILIKYGGYDRSSDITQIIKFAIHGDSGYDPEAQLFCRHHDGQLNRVAGDRGVVWCNILNKTFKTEGIFDVWLNNFSKSDVKLLRNFIKIHEHDSVSKSIINKLRGKNFTGYVKSIKCIVKNCPQFLVYSFGVTFLELLTMVYEKFFYNFFKEK